MSQITDLGREEIQQQWNMYQAQDELTYKYFKEMKELRKQDKEAWKKWNDEERILRAETMYNLPEGKYYIKNGTIMYKMTSRDIVSKASSNN